MIWVLWNVYEEMPHLSTHVRNTTVVLERCQHVFVDGAYPEFSADHPLSQDRTVEFCQDHGFYIEAPVSEPDKRTMGLRFIDNHAVDGDYIVVLDGDEELTSFALPSGDMASIDFLRMSDREWIPRTRVYRWRPGYEFRGRHFTLYLGDEMVASLTGGTICGTGIHHNTSHAPERVEAKKSYYSWLTKHEWEMAR